MITNAAIMYPNGDVIDARHHWQIVGIQAKMGVKTDSSAIQGFINHKGEFLTRQDAKAEAIAEGQLDKDHQGTLYSEDLWPNGVDRDSE